MDIKTKTVTLTYKHPVPVNGKLISTNDFLEVNIDEKSFFLSVLEGLHISSLKEVEFKIKQFFDGFNLNLKNIDHGKKFFNTIDFNESLNNVNHEQLFFIESILFNLIHQDIKTDVLKNSLYYKNYSLQENASKKCLKIKIRPDDDTLDETLSIIKKLLKINPDIIIRLDGNRQFELNDLLTFCERLDHEIGIFNLDYIEEPFKYFHDFLAFSSKSPIPLALDESVPEFIKKTELLDKISANYPLIFKPSLMGLSPIYDWLTNKERQKRRAIISTTYEHPSLMPGLYFLAQIANTYGQTEYHGLENYLSE